MTPPTPAKTEKEGTAIGLNAECSKCGHKGELWIDEKIFAELLVNAVQKSDQFKSMVRKAELCGRMAGWLRDLRERLTSDGYGSSLDESILIDGLLEEFGK
jgi:hypothetical protein